MSSSSLDYNPEDKLVKLYKDNNVFQEAMVRIDKIHSMFDHIFISFSGGKDSLVCLKLFELYRKAHGIKEKLNVVFYDEELVDTHVLAFCKKLMDSGKYNFQWWCAQLESEKFILGHKEKYIQWDENRPHIRPIPEWALTCPGVRYQDKMYLEYTRGYRGKICTVLGLRAQESLNRLRGVFSTSNKLPFLNAEIKNVTVAKPIYDWTEKDVFKFFYDFKIEYCDTYDYQVFNGDRLRVSTPLHAEAAKSQLLNLKTKDPVLYDQIMSVFPEVELQVRYFRDIKGSSSSNSTAGFEGYEHSWEGVIKYARDLVDDELIDKVIKKIIYCKRYRERPDNKRPLGGYPILYMFQMIQRGAYKRLIPMKFSEQITDKDFEFEGLTPPEKESSVK